jgi:hypothetical protein
MDRFGDLIPPGNYRFQGRAIPPGFVMGERDAQQLPPLPPGFVLEGAPQRRTTSLAVAPAWLPKHEPRRFAKTQRVSHERFPVRDCGQAF